MNITSIFIRTFDIILSFGAIAVLFPLMLPIMIVLKLTGEHDIFYKQKRVGRYGREFYVLKFATMLRNSPNMEGGCFTEKNDPRILPIGTFLRKTKINELPQLFNIFIGQMSIVGYRPLVISSYEQYDHETRQAIFNVQPGLSSIGSIIFRAEEKMLQNIIEKKQFYDKIILPYKGKLETWYTRKNNISNYFKIIFVTIICVIKPTSRIYEKIFLDLPIPPEELLPYL